MHIKGALATALSLAFLSVPAAAQETPQRAQITMGNGAANAIQVEGVTRQKADTVASSVRVDGADVSTLRANSTRLTFPEVTIEKPGWLVLHPVIDGRPDGDIVSGFTYLDAGQNADVAIRIQHPAGAGDKFLVMLHSDVDQDRVFDFVFVEDGINVEDTAVFEGTRMIAHLISLPE
ncbi:hypothetical protein SAMN02745824_1593 [Parasphingorhabdus marina DSM 22363]|uniref:DUF7282 domain-containing protein n=1 Tax=Parasphingorhabdus marina DSM 22363 TaxID=1123272 RepID=A0A1N6D5U9_9SPHN|nr:hypothetical protein [Parasphingorhabdus marina]SIN66210.1 hypothetical protein SAMN02745824_1593 [Parasphingorhabdus marina DSM 22363]